MFAKVCVVLDEYEEFRCLWFFATKCMQMCEGLWRERVGGMLGILIIEIWGIKYF